MTDEEELFALRKEVVELRHKLALALRHRDGHHITDEPEPHDVEPPTAPHMRHA